MWKKLVESLLLIGAIACLIPPPPSDLSPIDFLPRGAVATLLFLGSRLLRHAGRGGVTALISGAEAVSFLVLAWLLNASANILLTTHS